MSASGRHSRYYPLTFDLKERSERLNANVTPLQNQIGGGRTRIRTRVFGLEGQSDIQTTLYVLNRCDGLLFKKVTID